MGRSKGTKKQSGTKQTVSYFDGERKKWTAIIVTVLVAVVTTVWLERVNAKVQMDRRLNSDPEVSQWLTSMKTRIHEASAYRSNHPTEAVRLRLPEAIQYGTIAELVYNNPGPGRARTLYGLEIAEPGLHHGPTGKKDNGDQLYISVLNHSFTQGLPKLGENWVFAIARDPKGDSFLHSCVRSPQRR